MAHPFGKAACRSGPRDSPGCRTAKRRRPARRMRRPLACMRSVMHRRRASSSLQCRSRFAFHCPIKLPPQALHPAERLRCVDDHTPRRSTPSLRRLNPAHRERRLCARQQARYTHRRRASSSLQCRSRFALHCPIKLRHKVAQPRERLRCVDDHAPRRRAPSLRHPSRPPTASADSALPASEIHAPTPSFVVPAVPLALCISLPNQIATQALHPAERLRCVDARAPRRSTPSLRRRSRPPTADADSALSASEIPGSTPSLVVLYSAVQALHCTAPIREKWLLAKWMRASGASAPRVQ